MDTNVLLQLRCCDCYPNRSVGVKALDTFLGGLYDEPTLSAEKPHDT